MAWLCLLLTIMQGLYFLISRAYHLINTFYDHGGQSTHTIKSNLNPWQDLNLLPPEQSHGFNSCWLYRFFSLSYACVMFINSRFTFLVDITDGDTFEEDSNPNLLQIFTFNSVRHKNDWIVISKNIFTCLREIILYQSR